MDKYKRCTSLFTFQHHKAIYFTKWLTRCPKLREKQFSLKPFSFFFTQLFWFVFLCFKCVLKSIKDFIFLVFGCSWIAAVVFKHKILSLFSQSCWQSEQTCSMSSIPQESSYKKQSHFHTDPHQRGGLKLHFFPKLKLLKYSSFFVWFFLFCDKKKRQLESPTLSPKRSIWAVLLMSFCPFWSFC